MKKNISMGIGELFTADGRLRRHPLINTARLIERCEVIVCRDTMTGADVVIVGSDVLRAYRPNSGAVPMTLLIELDVEEAEFLELRDAVARVKGCECEYVRLG